MKITDKERVDWLQKTKSNLDVRHGYTYINGKYLQNKTLRQAIDAEIKRQKRVRK